MAKSIGLAALLLALLVGVYAWGAEPSVMEKVLSAWKDGKPPKGAAGPTPEAKRLESYEIVSAATTTQDGVDTVIGTVTCLFSEGPGTLTRWKGVFRITMDPAAPEGRKVSVEWQPMAGKVAAPDSTSVTTIRHSSYVAGWYPWGGEWSALRGLVEKCYDPDVLSRCRDVLSKALGPWETGHADKWYDAALVKDYRRTLDALIAQMPLAKPAPTGPAVEFAGPDGATLMTAICGLQENETPNDPDKRPRAVKEAEAKGKVRGCTWHVLLTHAVNEAQPPATPWYALGTYSVEAGTLEVRLGLPSSASGVRVHLGTAQVPLKPDVADAVKKGFKRVEMEVWCRINPDDIKTMASARGKTLQPGVTFTGLLVRDAGTQEILYRWTSSAPPAPVEPLPIRKR